MPLQTGRNICGHCDLNNNNNNNNNNKQLQLMQEIGIHLRQ